MTLEEIIKKQKEHLTKAQIGELIQATERYKQLNASNRASAMRTLSDQYRATRRGLQNTGLAGRKGKLVSGQEKAARIRANEAYRSYNAGLRQIDNAYAQNRAARMSYQNAQANQLAETERIQAENDKEAARINAEYEAWIRKKKAAEEALKRRQEAERARLERAEKERLKQMEQARQDRQDALYDAMHPGSKFDRRPQTIDEGRAENNQALIRQQRAAQQGAARRQAGRQEYIYDYLNGRAQTQYEAPIPERLRKLYEEANANEERWDAAIKRGNLPVPKNKEHTYESNDADKARREKAANESAISREVLAGQYPQYAELLRMSDEEFAVAYYAAKTMYARYADDYIAPQSEGEAARPISAEQYNKSRIAAPAVERFAAMENAKRLRDESSTKAYYYDTFGADESLVPKKPSWMRSANSSGPMMDNWKTASKRGWSASDYKGKSKYDALVNEWSLLNGPTYLLATQTHKTNKFMSNVRDLLTASGLNTDAAYNWFVDECLSEFWYRKTGNKNYITGGEGSQHIDMEAMLTLANLMTDEERARFNTILRDGSAAEADKYFEYLYNEVLPQRYLDKVNGENRFQTRDSLGRLRESLISVPNNISEGIGGVGRAIFGTNRTNDPSSAMVNASRNNTAQSIREAVGSHYSGVGNFLYQTGMSMADSATVGMISGGLGSAFSKLGMPAKWASRAGSVLGGSILGGSAYNSAYAEALQRGLSPDKARATALGQGFNEMLFESLSLDLLVSQFQKGGILKVSKNGFVNWVVNTLVQGGVEGSEEVFTDIANSLWDKHINGIYSEELTKLREYIAQGMSYEEAKRKVADEFNEQLGMSFLGGAISGGVMGGGASFLGMLQGHDVAKIGRNLDDAAKAEIREYDFKNEEAKEILTGKLTDEDYGRLAMTRLEEMAQTDPVAAEKAAQALIDATARTDVKVDKRNQTLKTGTENTVSFNYDGVTDVKKMSGVQVEALRFAQTLVKSKVGGVNINVANQLYDKNGNEQNGWYDAKTNTVHVSLNGSQSVVYTISHELTHRLKDGNAEAYASMRDAMKSELESLDLTGSDLPSDYSDILGDYLVKDGVQRTAWEALVNYEMDRYAKHGIELSREAAEEEVVCRACETMLEKSRLISSMVSRNVRSAKKIAKLLASIYDDIASLKAEAESRGYEDGSPEKMFIDQYTDIEKIANAWAAAMKGVSEKEGKRKPRTERIAKSKNGDYARLSKSETAKASGNIDVTADVVAEGENGKPLSIKSLDFDMRSGKMYKDLVEHGVMTEEEVVKFDRFLKDLVAYIKPNRAFLDMNESYTKDNRPFTAFKDNSDPLYKLSLDFSTLCRKRLTTQYIIEKLQLKLKKALSAEEQLAVRDMLKQYQKIDKGLQVACGMCYVEAARYKSPKQINMWLESDGRRKAMTQYFAVTDKQFTETVKQKQAEWKVQHGYADNATKDAMSASDRNAFNRMSYDLRQSYEMDAEHQAILDKALSLPKEQFLSAANLAELAEGDEAERTIYNAYTRFIRAATRSKSLEADIPYYYGDSESRVSDTFVRNVNSENGMRFDSWSDFQFTHLLDMITAIADLSVRGSAMHGYTKFPEFVRMFGKTGAMFNLSGVPQGIGLKQDGSLDFSPTESINEEEAIKLREEFPETAGFQSIGINDRHINALLDSDFIDYVIPYHVSGMNAKLRSIAKIAGWSNYQDVQNAKIDHSLDGNKAKCDPAVWHVEPVFSEFFVGYNTGMSGIDAMRASAKRYVDMCHERGLKPKFEKFLDNANYWKLLIDRKMINQKTGALIEQKAVKPNFDLDTIKREIDKYVNSYDQNREENAFNYIVDRWDEVPALVAKLEKEGRAEKKRQQEAAKNIDMLKGEMVNAMPGRLPLKAAAQKFSIKESDREYMSLAQKVKDGTATDADKAELRKQVDAAAERAMRNSKIRMPDGKLRRLYHGTYSDEFNVFDKSLIGTAREGDTGFFGKGFYFTFHKGEARMYGRRVIDAYVNITNPFNFETELNTMNGERAMSYNGGRAVFVTNFAEKFHELAKNQSVGTFTKDGKWKEISFAQFAKDFRTVYETVKFNVEEIDGAYGKEWLVTAGEHEESYTNENGEMFKWKEYAYQRRYMDERSAHDQAENAYEYLSKTKYEAKLPASAAIIMDTAFSEELIKRNYDGVIQSEDGDEVVAFESSQVKKADLVTYDDKGNIIPLSERFKTDRTGDEAWKNEDIRYSLKDDVKQTDITEYEHFNEEKYANMSETERIEYREHIAEMQIRKEARERQRAIDRNRRIRRDLTATLKKGNDRIVQLLSRPTENAHVPVQLAQAVSEYAMRLNDLLTKSEPKTGEFAGMEKQTKKGALNAQKILDAYRRSFADKETIALAKAENPKYDPRGLLPTSEYDEQLVKMIEAMDSVIQGKRMSDLTTDELRLVMNTMRGVIHAVTDANKLIGTNENKTIWKAGDQMVEQLENAPSVSQKIRGYLETSLDLRRLAKVFSGSNENAEFVKLVDQLNKGAIEKERIAQTLQSIFKPVTDQYGEEIRKWYGKNAEWIDTGITQNGKKVEITKGMRVSLAMHVLNAGNMNHIANGGITIPNREQYNKGKMTDAYANGETVQLSAEQIEEIISHMTEAEKAYVEAAKEFFHKRTGYYVNKTSLQLLGYRKATVENYFPIHTDKNFTKTDFASLQMDGSIEGQGFLKERVNASNPVYLEDITSVVNRQIRGVALYAGLAVPMRNFNAVMNSTEYFEDENGVWRPRTTVRKAMTQKMGEYGAKVVKGFLEDASEMSHVDVTPMERFAGKLATNYVKAVLLGNLKVAMKQVASYPTAAAVIPWKYLGKALLKGGRNHRLISRADVDLINQYTPLYRMRREGQANEIASIMAKRGMEQKLPWLLGWITKMDVMTVGRLWSAAEYMVADQQKNLPVGSDEYYKAVAKVFNDTIQQTQPNFTPLQRNAALRSKNPVVRSLVLFGTQRMQNGGILMEAAYELKHSKGKSKAEIKAAKMKLGRAVASQIVQNILLIVASLGVDALRGRMKSWQDEDKDITPESMMKGMGDMFLSNFIGSFLGGSETYSLFSGLFKKAMGETAYDTEFTVPALDAVETLINFAQSDVPSTIKYLLGDHTDEEKQKKAINFSYQLAKAFGYATGIPLENALKDVFKGIIPAIEDISDAIKTGELNLYLHQSGKLDNAKTAENYKEWTNLGKKGSVYLAWENRFKEDTSNGLDHRAELLFEDSALTADEKAIILRMSNSTKDNPLTSKDGVVYKEDGTVAVDFTNLDRYRASTMLSDKQYEGFLNLVDMGVAEDVASTAFIQYNVQKKQGSGANDRFRDWLFATVKNPEDRAKVDMAVVGNTVRVEGTIGYKENGEVYADYSSKEMFDLYTSGKKQQKSDAIISTTDTPEAKAKAFADTDNDYHAKGGIVYNDKDKVVADFTSDEAYRASQMGETHYAKYNDAVKHGMSKENAILAVEKHKEITNDDDKDNATQYATWVFNTYKSANDRAIAGAIYSSKPVTIKDGRTYDENGYIYRDYTSAAWYKLSNRSLSKDGVNKRYEAAKLLEQDGYTAEQTVAAYVEMDKLSKKSEWQKWLKDHGYTNEQINIFLWSRGWAKLQ